MTKNRAAIALSTAALVVAALGQTAVGDAAANAVRIALFAQNSERVNNIQASRTPMPGRLVPLNAKGKLPASVLPEPGTGGSSQMGDSYTHTLFVHPDENVNKAGTGLLNVLSGITDNSASNPYLIKIEPGIYHLGTGSVPMKPYVDVEGSGEGVTILTSTNSSGYGTVIGADHSELRFLSVTNTGGGQQSVALFSESTSPRFTHLTAAATGGSENYGIHISNGSPVLTNVTATASGGAQSFAVGNFNGNVTVLDSTFGASDAAGLNIGLLTTFGGLGPGRQLGLDGIRRNDCDRHAVLQREPLPPKRDRHGERGQQPELWHLQRAEDLGPERERAPVPDLGADEQRLRARWLGQARSVAAHRPGRYR